MTRAAFGSFFLLCAVGLCAPLGAQPERTAAIDKAKAKYEAETAKAEEALLASFEKAIAKAKAANNKPMTEKLTYEKELFVAQRIIPTAVPAAAYTKQRAQAISALEAVYLPAIKDLVKAKKDTDADALEAELSGLLKASRGYGLALPDLEPKPLLLIESKSAVEGKAAGTVLEAPGQSASLAGKGPVSLATKVGKKRPVQCWTIEREEKGVVFKNAASGYLLYSIPRFGTEGYVLSTRRPDPMKDTPEQALFRLAESRREVTIGIVGQAGNGQLLTSIEKKLKGVTTFELVFENKEAPVPITQLWVITEAK